MSTERPPLRVFDIESPTGWDKFGLAVMMDEYGEKEVAYSLPELQRMVERTPGNLWAHSGGTYDFLFLSGKDEVILSGSRVLRAKVGKARLCDSFPLMQMSLEKVGQAVGVHKTKVDRTRLDELSTQEVEDYCAQDCQVLLAALKAHRDFIETVPHPHPRLPTTSGASAVYCAEAWDAPVALHLSKSTPSFEDWEEQRGTVMGGRCELWRLGHVRGPVYYYDVKSSYPSRYLEGPLPVGPWRKVNHAPRAGTVGVFRVKFSQPKDRLPLLTSSPPDGYGGVHAHEGEGWATSEEIEVARAELGARVEVLHGWVSELVGPLGRRFVEKLFRLKEEGQPFAKVTFNSLHGKFGQNILNGVWRRHPRGWVYDEELSVPRWYQRPLVEGAILARARIGLWRTMDALRVQGWRVLYTDTDSVHTDCPPSLFPGTLGEAPGEWDLKLAASEALYLAPKVYALRHEDEDGKDTVTLASKGFPSSQVTWETMWRAWHEAPLPVSATQGLIGFRSGGRDTATARVLTRTLAAHPGAGKKRTGLDGCEVWYSH